MDKKILVIEDDKDILNNVVTLLNGKGYITERADDGYEGIKIAKSEQPDLVICDIIMPGLDGYGVLNEFSKCSELKTIPFIFLTAKSEKEDFRKGMEMGADDYIVKPFKAMDLLKAIQTRLKKIETFRNSVLQKKDNDINKKYKSADKIFLRFNGKPYFIEVNQIASISSERQYTSIKHISGRPFIMRKSISYWEKVLPEEKFIRIHRSTIINFDLIDRIEFLKNSRMKIYLNNYKEPFLVSKRYSSKLKKNMV